MLHQIEHAKNIRICFDHNHTAPVIEPIQVPVLPQTDEAHVCTERRTRRQMIGRANVDAVPLKRFCPVKVKFRPAQCQLLTAMRMLTGLSHPTEGKARVAGFNVATRSEDVKRNIGYMSQKFSLYEDLKVWENIRLFAGIYGIPEPEIAPRTDELLLRLGLEKERDTLVKNLPLGWKQKLAFSVSIFHHPKIVFLDEPTGGVDPATRRQFWELIYQAADQGITVFVTTHFMDEAEYCDRISIMVDGVIRALDTPDRLKRQFGVETMDDVFQQLAREAVRTAD